MEAKAPEVLAMRRCRPGHRIVVEGRTPADDVDSLFKSLPEGGALSGPFAPRQRTAHQRHDLHIDETGQ